MKYISVSILFVAGLGLLAHLGGLWFVYHRNTAGFAVSLRNGEIVSPEMAHAIGLITHIVGILLSVILMIGAVLLFRNRDRRLCTGLGLAVSIPAISPLFGLAFPLGIAAVLLGLRSGRLPRQTNPES